MKFALTDVQRELKSEAHRWLTDRFPATRIAELSDEGAWDEASWQELADLGWLGVSVSEDAGGVGLSFLEEAVLFEEFGWALYPGPYVSTVGLALPALTAEQQGEVASGARRWSAEIDGLVPDLDKVHEVVSDGRSFTANGSLLESVDPTRSVGHLRRDGEGGPAGVVDLPRALTALALEATGIAQRALELGIEAAQQREQFGKPIGAFQGVSHQLATSYVETELARSLAYWAATCIATHDPQASVAASAAKAWACDAAVASCERTIQVNGGIGFTWEHVIHRYYKRALWLAHFAGTSAEHRLRVADVVLA